MSELKQLNADLERMLSDPQRPGPTHVETKIRDKIVELNYREEVMWQQRSRINWLAEGDWNTRFFHLRATLHRKKNKITKLKTPIGGVTKVQEEMGISATSFYKELYRSEGTENMGAVLDTVPIEVTAEMNSQLLALLDEGEVKTALFQMFPTKAPGPGIMWSGSDKGGHTVTERGG